ncbi:uncharacterized protein B0P05DRAFT_564130 [Gilbertella persicaria]|uniref:uncharacterized protein n=1 Tax=Gilbertella persicaria TaxID=101096 RepID=UPI00221E5B9C|nr:uncharacterized protein B0P05DRAFT_565746 [Gilbertella persicaria]XP_051429676.1 uncharacterized protein B0P05DRAFT_564130 [Gilbertella persicaria]KAI8047591.1 hypothetical protein B0P05DRAFT_565746 [Gilbertella persicaria]KAI8048959.1 hypothetical protein B0P05DRAFT_564130 [Gilbertella persicaria]
MDFVQSAVQQTNLASLLGLHLCLSLLGAVASNPTYNIPIFFFGIWAFNNRESTTPLKTFAGALGLSIFLDLIWFYLHGGNPQAESGFGFAKFFNVISLFVKPFTVYSAANILKERGDSLNAGNWSEAPGAFPSGGYQNVRDGDSAEFP